MTHPSKVKGNTFEREIVKHAQASGIAAERAYASNGRALGECEATDCVIGGKRVQAKRRAKLPGYLQVPDGVDAVVFRQDFGEPMALLSYWDWLDLVKADGEPIEPPPHKWPSGPFAKPTPIVRSLYGKCFDQ